MILRSINISATISLYKKHNDNQNAVIRTFLSVYEETAYLIVCYFRQWFNSIKYNKDNRHAAIFIIS
jgi:hypothetical protein